jgi:hypothetical protein
MPRCILYIQPEKNMSEITTLDFSRIYDHFSKMAIEKFNTEGSVPPLLVMVKFKEGGESTGDVHKMGVVAPETTEEFFSGEEGKDKLSMFIRESLTEGEAFRAVLEKEAQFAPDAILQISEAWVATAANAEDIGTTPPSQRANRKEALLVVIHHRWGGSVAGMHTIEDEPTRHATFQELDQKMVITGRMAMTPPKMSMH